jgi:hypothetical protein
VIFDYRSAPTRARRVSETFVGRVLLQQVLAQPHWSGKLTTRDLGALTPLFSGSMSTRMGASNST